MTVNVIGNQVAEVVTNKNQPGGYAGLDQNGAVLLSHTNPAVIQSISYAGPPTFTGTGTQAVVDVNGATWVWSGSAWVENTVTSPDGSITVAGTSGSPTLVANQGLLAGTNPRPPWKVRGNLIRSTVDGKRVLVRGQFVYGYPYYAAMGSTLAAATVNNYTNRAAILAYMASQKMNTVRIPTSSADFAAIPYTGITSQSQYTGYVVGWQQAAQQAGLMSLIQLFGATGYGTNLSSGFVTNDEPMITALYATELGNNNPWVMWSPFNEPHGPSGSQWLTGVETAISFFRTTLGYTGILFFDTPNYSAQFATIWPYIEQAIAYDAAILGTANLVISQHKYPLYSTWVGSGDLDAWELEIGHAVGYCPIVIEETGFASSGDSLEVWPDWNLEFYDYLNHGSVAKGYPSPVARGLCGWISFAHDWVNPDGSVIAGASATATVAQLTTPNSYGQMIRDRLNAPSFANETVPPSPEALSFPAVHMISQFSVNLNGATGGTWTLSLDGNTGATLQWNASTFQVMQAIQGLIGQPLLSYVSESGTGLPNMGKQDIDVIVTGTAGNYTVTLPYGAIPGNTTSGTPAAHVTVTSSLTGASGAPTVTQPGPSLALGRIYSPWNTGFSLPGTYNTGDTLMLVAGISQLPTLSSGWTWVTGFPSLQNGFYLCVATRTATGSDTAPVLTTTANAQYAGGVMVFRGGRLGTPTIDEIALGTSAASSSTTAMPRVAVPNNNSLRVGISFGQGGATGTYNAPPGESLVIGTAHNSSFEYGIGVTLQQMNAGYTLNKPSSVLPVTTNTEATAVFILS